MVSRKTPNEWSHALRVLRYYPDRFPRMGEHVLPIMKFSYDSLPCPIMKEIFFYIALCSLKISKFQSISLLTYG